MEKIKNLVGTDLTEVIGSNEYNLKIDHVSVGDVIIPNKIGIVITNKEKIYSSIVSDEYIFISHTELKNNFLKQLKEVYKGELIEKEKGILRYKYSVILKDMIYKISEIPYEIRNNLPGQDLGDEIAPILSIKNSYNGKDKISIEFGIYRFYCKNILDRIFKAFLQVSYIHRGKIIEDLDFNIPLIVEIINLISVNFRKLIDIKVNGEEFVKEYSKFINNKLVYTYLTKFRSEYISGDISLWQAINEITYLTTHRPKVKIGNKIKFILSQREIRKSVMFLYNFLETYLSDLYKELNILLQDTNYTVAEEIEDNYDIEIEEVLV